MNTEFVHAASKRRSIYFLGCSDEISQKQVKDIINDCIKYTPSAFNMATTNLIVAFGEKHHQIWQIARDVLTEKLQKKEDTLKLALEKIDRFNNAMGTILYYEDRDMINELKDTYAMYADSFSVWSMQASGMLQYAIWTALADNDIGANLQHYNPLIDDKVKELFSVPDTWKLIAQMPFGSIEKQPSEKYFEEIDNRVKYY